MNWWIPELYQILVEVRLDHALLGLIGLQSGIDSKHEFVKSQNRRGPRGALRVERKPDQSIP
jgi:hypothetical protein